MFELTLVYYLALAAILFCVGLLGTILSKHLIRVLISVEFMFNAVNINLVACANYNDLAKLDGQILTLFIMAVAVCELAIGLAVLYLLFAKTQSVSTEAGIIEDEKWK